MSFTKRSHNTKHYLMSLQGRGGDDCEFYATISPNGQHVIFESAKEAGSHIGALPSGQITAPAQTTKGTDASHFFVRFVVSYNTLSLGQFIICFFLEKILTFKKAVKQTVLVGFRALKLNIFIVHCICCVVN